MRDTGSQAGGMQGAVKAPAHPDTESELSPNVDAKPSRTDEGSHITMLERLSTETFNSLGSLEYLGGTRPQRSNVSLPSRGPSRLSSEPAQVVVGVFIQIVRLSGSMLS